MYIFILYVDIEVVQTSSLFYIELNVAGKNSLAFTLGHVWAN